MYRDIMTGDYEWDGLDGGFRHLARSEFHFIRVHDNLV